MGWAKSRNAINASEKALKVLDRMETLPNATNDGSLTKPNAKIYTAAMKTFRKPTSEPINKARGVYSLHERMLDDYLSGNEDSKPNVDSFNTILQVCSKAATGDIRSQVEAFGIATQALQDLRDSPQFGNADSITYRRILECCSNLLPPGKKQLQAIE